MKSIFYILAILVFATTPAAVLSQVLGPCGTEDAQKPQGAEVKAATVKAAQSGGATVSTVPLPGSKAPNFELAAVLGNGKVEKVKLSDFDGKWRVVCFYPADFTFV